MKKLALFAAALAFAPSLLTISPVFATSPGQLSTGPDQYVVKNVTKNTAYSSAVTATCDETVKFSLKLANSEYGQLENVTVKATLAGAVNASATNAAGSTTSINANVAVNVTKGNLVYVPGSTQNLDVNGNLIKTLADGITTSGVNKGSLKGSTREFVQFQAKVVCEPVVVPKDIQVCELATKTIKTIKENEFDASKHSKNLDDCKTVEVKKIQVCVLSSKTIATINENEFDTAKHSKNLNDCKTVVVPGKIQVCELATKKVITISETDFDASKHDKDLNKCAVVAGVTTTPAVIASTGPASTAITMLGLGSLAAAATYYVRSRRANILG